MPKINQEEYEVLKELDDKWKWIARDRDTGKLPYSDMVHVYEEKPFKTGNVWTVGYGAEKLEKNTFQFIQWEDSEPYEISELIEEYEEHEFVKINQDGRERLDKLYGNESEEMEVKSKQELIDKWESAIGAAEFYGKGKEEKLISYMKDFLSDLEQLGEPETLSQEWIDNHTDKFVSSFDLRFVSTKDLQNLLVPKREEVKIESVWAEDIEDAKASGMTLFKAMNWMAIDSDEKEKQDLFARAWLDGFTVEEQKYYVMNNENELLLSKNKDDEVITYSQYYPQVRKVLSDLSHYQLTEQEIIDYDPRYMTFAKPVEELEE